MVFVAQANMIFKCRSRRSDCPVSIPIHHHSVCRHASLIGCDLVIKVVRSSSREVELHQQLGALPELRVLPLVAVLNSFMPDLSALVMPRAECLVDWVAEVPTARTVVPVVIQLLQVRLALPEADLHKINLGRCCMGRDC